MGSSDIQGTGDIAAFVGLKVQVAHVKGDRKVLAVRVDDVSGDPFMEAIELLGGRIGN